MTREHRMQCDLTTTRLGLPGRAASNSAPFSHLSRWTVLHVGAAIVMYPLLALHIWNGICYGLRWVVKITAAIYLTLGVLEDADKISAAFRVRADWAWNAKTSGNPLRPLTLDLDQE